MLPLPRTLLTAAVLASSLTPPVIAQAPRVTEIQYGISFTARTAATRSLAVTMTFRVASAGTVALSLPAWTPGAYELSWFARNVSRLAVRQGDMDLRWDKLDYDTWRIQVPKAGAVSVSFDYLADALDNAMAWSRDDFLLLNGTNVFPYPEGQGLDFPATVVIRTEPDWRVATGMRPGPTPGTYQEANYHDLVDMPLFIGRFDLDSVNVNGKVTRVATYPEGGFRGVPRLQFLDELGKAIPAMARVFGETPWDDYTVMVIFEPSYGGGSALEHQSSHVGIYNPQFIGTPILPSITAHEIFHAWNVKRLRPAELWPYRYDQAQPTSWLWVSEGITDYYADLALVRGGIVDSTGWLDFTQQKVTEVAASPPVALEDASLSTWIHPTDGTGYIYYPKGGLAGLLIDILIRDASDNRGSLDDVMRTLYQGTWARGRGFTAEDWWGAVTRAAGGRSFEEFAARYIDGREPFPWDTVLPLAGLRLATDSINEPRVGVSTSTDTTGTLVLEVVPGSMADAAGVQVGDHLLRVGEIDASTEDYGAQYRERYAATAVGTPIVIVVRRNNRELSLAGQFQLARRVEQRIEFAPDATPKAARIRSGLLRGVTDR
jgi:predicted metalloprotease with PDZ domain